MEHRVREILKDWLWRKRDAISFLEVKITNHYMVIEKAALTLLTCSLLMKCNAKVLPLKIIVS